MNLNDILTSSELNILSKPELISGLNEYMASNGIMVIMINDYVLYANDVQFRLKTNEDLISELDNCYYLYQFFIKYQYYNLAAAVRNNMVCSFPAR